MSKELDANGAKESPSRYNRKLVLKEGGWVFGGQIATMAAYGIGLRVVTSVYPPDAYGSAALALGLVALGTQNIVNPVLVAQARLYPDFQRRGISSWFMRHAFWSMLKRLRWVLIPLALLDLILLVLGYNYYAAVVLLSFLIATGIWSYSIFTNFVTAERRQRAASVLRFFRYLFPPAIAVAIGLFLIPSALGLLSAEATAGILLSAAAYGVLFHKRQSDSSKPRAEDVNSIKADTIKIAVPLSLVAVGTWVSALSDRYVIGLFLGTHSVGVYSANYGLWAQPFIMLGAGLILWLRPILFGAVSEGNAAIAAMTIRRWLLAGVSLSIIGGIILYVGRELVFTLFLDPKYRAADGVVIFIMIAYSCSVASICFSQLLAAELRTKEQILPVLVAAFLNIALNFAAIPYLGLLGAAIVTAFSFGVEAIWLGWIALRNTDKKASAVTDAAK